MEVCTPKTQIVSVSCGISIDYKESSSLRMTTLFVQSGDGDFLTFYLISILHI